MTTPFKEPSIEASFDKLECVGYSPNSGKPIHYAYDALFSVSGTQISRSDDHNFGASAVFVNRFWGARANQHRRIL